MEIPLPDGSPATISQGEVSTAEKVIRSMVHHGRQQRRPHLKEYYGQLYQLDIEDDKWTPPSMSGMDRIQIQIMARDTVRTGNTSEAMQSILQKENFKILPFLGTNCNVKWEWRTLHQAFGGIGLFDLAVKHTIGMINILVQHYRAGTTLMLKYSSSLEALQLEIGCTGNPLEENYKRYHCLATESWVKSLWEQLHYYRFLVYLVYTHLELPQRNDVTLVGMFWQAGYQQQQLQALNRCRLAHHLIFLSDMTLACGQNLDLFLLASPPPGSTQCRLSYVFPKLHPSQTDWKLWLDFWTSTTGNGGILHIPLGEWIHEAHRTWHWY